jgi:hypothetical protein
MISARPLMLYIFFLIAFIFSCSKREVTIKNYNEDGTFSVEKFNSMGKPKSKTTFSSEGKLNGPVFGFFPSGNIEYSGNYKNDERDSTWVWYNESGEMTVIENYLNGKRFGGQIKSNESGQIEHYKFFGSEGMFGIITMYEQEAKVEGSLHFLWYNKDTLSKGEIFSSIFFAGVPPGWESSLAFNLTEARDKKTIEEQASLSKAYVRNMDKYVLDCPQLPPGGYIVEYFVEIRNEKGDTIYADLLSHEFYSN